MRLHKFADKKGSKAIQADHLDHNFSRLKPLLQDGAALGYSVTETPEGWALNIFPPLPVGSGPWVLGFNGSQLIWLQTQACT